MFQGPRHHSLYWPSFAPLYVMHSLVSWPLRYPQCELLHRRLALSGLVGRARLAGDVEVAIRLAVHGRLVMAECFCAS
jgi:hypothetical protein